MDKWHLGRAGQRSGPFSWAQIVEMGRAGHLFSTDIVWQEGTASWVPITTYAGQLTITPAPAAAAPVNPVAATVAVPPPQPQQIVASVPSPQPPAVAPGAPAPLPAAPLMGPPVQLPDFGEVKKDFLFHFHRAVEWNLHDIKVTPEEEKELLALGVDDEDARRYHAWRRSVLWGIVVAGALAAFLGVISEATADHTNLNVFGGFLAFLRCTTAFVMPMAVWKAVQIWSKHARSRWFVGIGWATAFLAPLLFALFPMSWQYSIEGANSAQIGLVGAIASYVTLMPTVLALIPGVMRACLRIKLLLPQSILPGWFLIGASPFWIFLFLVIFATVNQVAGDVLLMIGVLAVAGAPILYLREVALLTRPILNDDDQKRVIQLQKYVRLILMGGVAFLILWLFTAKVFGMSIIGTEANTSLVRPWNVRLFEFPIEFASHSLCTMALAADLFMAMNLSVWKHTRAFLASDAAQDYDRRMGEIESGGSGT